MHKFQPRFTEEQKKELLEVHPWIQKGGLLETVINSVGFNAYFSLMIKVNFYLRLMFKCLLMSHWPLPDSTISHSLIIFWLVITTCESQLVLMVRFKYLDLSLSSCPAVEPKNLCCSCLTACPPPPLLTFPALTVPIHLIKVTCNIQRLTEQLYFFRSVHFISETKSGELGEFYIYAEAY